MALFDRLTANLQVKWITFHSGYDFGYLLKVLTCQPLPKTEVEFFELLKVCSACSVCRNVSVLGCSCCVL